MEETVIYKKKNGVGKIILNKPQERNALDLKTLKQLIAAFKQSEENEDLCVIFTAEGSDFTVGDDLKYTYRLLTSPNAFQEMLELIKSFQTLTIVMRNHSGIIIVGLKGWAIGGGFEMTLSADLRVASKDTKIMLPELDIGILFSNASTKLLPNIIGEAKAKELFLLGERINANEAYNLGLVNYVVEPEDLMKELDGIAQKILTKDPLALRLAKKLINEAHDANINAALDREQAAILVCGQSEGFKNRIKAFVEKKKPH